MKCSEIIRELERLAPLSMACDWDNPGLLAGRREKEVETVFLAVDATDAAIAQAKEAGADLILTHHPLIFRPVHSVTDGDFVGRRLLAMIQSDISYYAMHTNFDAAPGCMAQLAGDRLGLREMRPLEEMGTAQDGTVYGIGTCGVLARPATLAELAAQVKEAFGLPFAAVYGDLGSNREIVRVAVCPGAGGSTIGAALEAGAQAYITGDIGHHEGIDAVARDMAVIDAGHYGTESVFIKAVAEELSRQLPDCQVKAMEVEQPFTVI